MGLFSQLRKVDAGLISSGFVLRIFQLCGGNLDDARLQPELFFDA